MTIQVRTFSILLYALLLGTQLVGQEIGSTNKLKIDKRDRIDMAIQQEFEMTVDTDLNLIPRNRLNKARSIRDQKIVEIENIQSQKLQSNSGIVWEERGPTNVGGRTRAICFDKSDLSSNTMFAGSVSGGLWRTDNANDSQPNWTKVDDLMNNLAISSITQDPTNHNILYCGTGEGYYNLDAVQGNGIYKSIDHGEHWTHLESTDLSIFRYSQKLVVDNEGDLYVATKKGGLQKSTDGGLTFTKILGKNYGSSLNAISDLSLAKNGDLYASVGLFNTDGIYKSTDSGETWTKLENGLPMDDYSRIVIATAPSNSDYIYAMFNNRLTNDCKGIFRSTDGGQHWVEVNNPNTLDNANFLRKQGWYNMSIAVDPLDESNVIIGGIDLFQSSSAGLNFRQISQWHGAFGLAEVHADQHSIVFAPNSNYVFIGNDGGVWKTGNIQAENIEFENLNNGYNVTQFYSADFHPNPTSNYIVGGTQDNGTQLFSQDGMQSTREITGGDGGIAHFDQKDGDFIIASYVFNNYRLSKNLGDEITFRSLNNTGRFINPTDFDDESKKLYAANTIGTYLRYNDPKELGSDYSVVDVIGMENQLISSVKISPNILNRVYFGTGNGDLYLVDDAHNGDFRTGEKLFNGDGYLSSIDIEQGEENHIVISYSNYGVVSVYESLDGGLNWINIEGDLPDMPIRSVVFNPYDKTQILVATELGVWWTKKNSNHSFKWYPSNSGLANVRVDMIKFRSSDNKLLAATHGRGLFTTDYYAKSYLNFNQESLVSSEQNLQSNNVDCGKNYSTVSIPFRISKPSDEKITVSINQIDGNAQLGIDYMFDKSSIQLESGALEGDFIVKILDDGFEESDEKAIFELDSEDIEIGESNTVELIIHDNENNPFDFIINNDIVLSEGKSDISSTPFKGYYEDQRSQFLIRSEELLNSGFQSGIINKIGWFVTTKQSETPFHEFTIKIAESPMEVFNGIDNQFIEANWTIVYKSDYSTIEGWNDITFLSPFTWNGKSNLIIEICYNNSSISADDFVRASTYSEYLSQFKYSDSNLGCALVSKPNVIFSRPDFKFGQSRDIQTSNSICTKVVASNYPGQNHIFSENNKVLATVEHNDGLTTSCLESKISNYGVGKVDYPWLSNFSISEKQFLFRSEESFDGSITLYYNRSELSEWEDINSLKVIQSDDLLTKDIVDDFTIIPAEEIFISPISDNIIAFSFLAEKLGSFALTDFENLSVPVDLVYFSVTGDKGSNKLTWEVENEVNLDNYVIERGFDGTNFEEIGKVETDDYSISTKTYQFIDEDLPFSNKNYYYRLKIQDIDGSYKFSKIEAVFVKHLKTAFIEVYPNPFGEYLEYGLDNKDLNINQIQLTDVRGNIIIEKIGNEFGYSGKLETGGVLPGVYIFSIVDDLGERYQRTVVRM